VASTLAGNLYLLVQCFLWLSVVLCCGSWRFK
jgi:hypothetical protein